MNATTECTETALVTTMTTTRSETRHYRGIPYTIITTHDNVRGFDLPGRQYVLDGTPYSTLEQLKSEIDHRVNAAKLGRSDEESLI